ncbi:hypothetical protein OE88DRAFT_1663675 [Heliocybe sulcata]|uniref:Uncharacterized protein n=1 Tax=Heliocybe sulcata TaxID=5364 RepID=A0A5C3MUY9_9AGAM|nr:hypothetical protein OE88DRAFT_1663675 [Heliocybe sulcata]
MRLSAVTLAFLLFTGPAWSIPRVYEHNGWDTSWWADYIESHTHTVPSRPTQL